AASPERKKHPGADFGPGAFVLDTLGLTAGKLTLDPAAPVAMPEASAETRDVTVKFSPPLP
ncbi:MAG TPA: hypothetical protein VFZ54_12545, partial [Burkholderiales bacterium]